MDLTSTREGVAIALDALRANKVRAALTILGIVIGVATVMTMAAAINGFRSTVLGQVELAGPKNFVLQRFDDTQVQVDDGTGKPPWDGKPKITFDEVRLVESLPSVRGVIPVLNASGDVRAEARRIEGVPIWGRGWRWPEYDQGTFTFGQNFVPVDDERSAPVIVLSKALAADLFPDQNPVGRRVRIDNEQLTVVGVYQLADNLFASAIKYFAIVPASTLRRRFGLPTDWMAVLVVTGPDATQAQAMDEVTAALRTSRRLRPGDENNFHLQRPEEVAKLFNQLTGVFFVVMLVLSSIGLLVGGVGVIGIMMISVTERTREIGIRKALGATRREILWQFLVEAMTVTLIGGVIGLVIASLFTSMLKQVTPIPADIPAWAVLASLGMAAFSGIVFGLYPANRAARLDPVEALRYE